MFQHKEADRIPMIDSPWGSTIERWRREGLPEKTDPAAFFGHDLQAAVFCDNSPRYESKVIEETDDYVIATTNWGDDVSFENYTRVMELVKKYGAYKMLKLDAAAAETSLGMNTRCYGRRMNEERRIGSGMDCEQAGRSLQAREMVWPGLLLPHMRKPRARVCRGRPAAAPAIVVPRMRLA